MDSKAFEDKLRADGYLEIERKTYEPRPANGDHGHHFSVRGLVLAGAFIVTRDGAPTSYGPGKVFEVPEGQLHNEAIGPAGAEVLVGRKY